MKLTSLSHISHRLDDADSIVHVLEAIGLPLPKGGEALSAGVRIDHLAASGVGFSEHQVDEALDKTELPISDRVALKLSLYRHQLLRRAA